MAACRPVLSVQEFIICSRQRPIKPQCTLELRLQLEDGILDITFIFQMTTLNVCVLLCVQCVFSVIYY